MNELPIGWIQTTLGQVATWGSGGTPRATEPAFYGGTIPWAVIGDLNDSAVTETASAVTALGLASSSAKIVGPGTVLVAMYGSIGKLGIAGCRMATNQAIAFANGHPGIATNRYIFWFLRWQRSSLTKSGKGATQRNISQTILKAWPIPLPPYAEQERIVAAIEEHVSRLDAAERLLRSARRRADLMRASALAAATPADCKWKTLGEIAEIVGGVTKDSKRQSDPSFLELPYLRVANVQRGYLDLREIASIRVSPEKAKALRLEPGDILFNEGGDRDKLGRGWIWQGEIDNCIHQNHVFRARLLTNADDPKYISLHGNTFGQQWFERMGKQTTNLASINLKTLKSFPVPDVPLEDQHRIVAEVERRLTILASLSTAIDHALARSDHLRRSILESAFTGKLVPQVPRDHSAFELLVRIAPDYRKTATPRRRQRA